LANGLALVQQRVSFAVARLATTLARCANDLDPPMAHNKKSD
jgi:hypothetical protein